MFRVRRVFQAMAAALLLALLATTANAQWGYGGYYGWGGWGATPQGDIARGLGAYAQGLGVYNVNTAQAASINADTMMRWNSYIWASQNALNREHYYRLIAERERNTKLTNEIANRIRDTPNKSDIEHGDALNAILQQLSDPRIHPSALRMSKVPLKNTWIQGIPFHYASEAITLSLHNLTSKDWPPALNKPELRAEREGYEKALAAALEEDKNGDLKPETIQAVENAAQRLKDKFEGTFPQSSPDYIPGRNRIKAIFGMVRMLREPNFDKTLAALENYPGTTVADLLGFMQMFNLRFGAANTPEERALYTNLYPLMDQQRDEIMRQSGGTLTGNPPAPPANGQPGEIFHEMPWEHLTGRNNNNTDAQKKQQ